MIKKIVVSILLVTIFTGCAITYPESPSGDPTNFIITDTPEKIIELTATPIITQTFEVSDISNSLNVVEIQTLLENTLSESNLETVYFLLHKYYAKIQVVQAINTNNTEQNHESVGTLNNIVLPEENKELNSPLDYELQSLLGGIINKPNYDSTNLLFHKYYNKIKFETNNNVLHIILQEDINYAEDLFDLVTDCLFFASVIVDKGYYDIDRIELAYPDSSDWHYRFVLDGKENIKLISEDIGNLTSLLEFDISPTKSTVVTQNTAVIPIPTITQPTQLDISPTNTRTYPTNTVTYPTYTSVPPTSSPPQITECKAYTSGTVNCMIKKAYCSYQPSVKGQPTFCNDAPYPNHSFSYIVWGSDVSYLDGHCIFVYGKIEYYNGKPEISWQNNDGFDGYCD